MKELVAKTNAKVAVSQNTLDWSGDLERRAADLQVQFEDMRSLGFTPEELDLRDYFGRSGLLEKMKTYDAVWFRGSNTFLLVKAMKQSGFDEVIDKLIKPERLVYAGFSAAFCALSPSLHGMEIVDDKDVQADGYEPGEIWEGFGLIDFYPIVHFRSNHPESKLVEKEYEYIKGRGILFKTFRDSDAYFVNGDEKKVLT